MSNNREAVKPTTQEVETLFSNPERVKRDMLAINRSAEIMSNLVINGKATVEIKVDATGNKYANIIEGEDLIYSTRDPLEVRDLEDYLSNPEQHLRNLQLRKIEKEIQG